MRFNGKNTGNAHVLHEKLITLEGLSKDNFEEYEDSFYWLEEKMELDKYSKYLDMKDKQNTL